VVVAIISGIYKFMEVTRFILEILTTLAAIIVAVFAVKGINAWKQQMKGTTLYDAGKQLIVAAQRLYEVIQFVRQSDSVGGFQADVDERTNDLPEDSWFSRYTRSRIGLLTDEYDRFAHQVVKSIALIEDEDQRNGIRKACNKLRGLYFCLQNSLAHKGVMQYKSGHDLEMYKKIEKKINMSHILSDMPMYDGKENEFTADLNTSLRTIRDQTKKIFKI
jgi:hypothetical protein